MAQFALLFVVLWVVASALGKGSSVTTSKPAARNKKGGCNAYRGPYSKFGRKNWRYRSEVATSAGATNLPEGTVVL
jgi:hypothetical protein